MIDELGGTTALLVSKSLDAAALRHVAIATNIANVNTPGHAPLRVNFEEQLSPIRTGLLQRSPEAGNRLREVHPHLQTETVSRTTPVQLDMEMVQLAQNVLQYQALLKGLASKMAVIKLAIHEGRK